MASNLWTNLVHASRRRRVVFREQVLAVKRFKAGNPKARLREISLATGVEITACCRILKGGYDGLLMEG